MTDRSWRWLAPAVVAVLIVPLSVGCAKRPSTTAASAPAPTAAGATATTSTTATAPSPARMVAPPTAPGGAPTRTTATARLAPGDFAPNAALQDIHFAFDKYDITKTEAAVLDGHATWLKTNAGHLLLIEGHADERGTNEYNLALGDRRAKATTNYLISRGVAATRITVISYGEDRPACREHTEECWAKNRRAHFLVKAQ